MSLRTILTFGGGQMNDNFHEIYYEINNIIQDKRLQQI